MASLGTITYACENPDSLSEFWTETLDYEIEEPPPEIVRAIEAERGDFNAATVASNSAGDGSQLSFTRMPRSSSEHIPIHLDLTVDDREVKVERLTELGASIVETKTGTTGLYSLFFTYRSSQEHTATVVVYRKAVTNPAGRAVLARCLSVLTITDTQIADGGGVSLAQRSPQSPGETA